MSDSNVDYTDCEIFVTLVQKIVKQEMKKQENYIPFLLPGEIFSINGGNADVYINGSTTETPDIPINSAITVEVGDSVWILKVNFQDVDMIVLCKRIIV